MAERLSIHHQQEQTRSMSARHVHLVGSVPMRDAREVFETVSAALGQHLLRIPDGETGKRLDWITWLEPLFADHRAFEPSGTKFRLHAGVEGRTRYRLRPGKTITDVAFNNLFYADIARQSYDVFADLKRHHDTIDHGIGARHEWLLHRPTRGSSNTHMPRYL